MMASFSALCGDFSSIALIVPHSLEWSDLWSSVPTNYIHDCIRCSFVVLVIWLFTCCRAGDVGSLDMRSSRALIVSNMYAGTGSVLRWCCPEGIWCETTFRIMVRMIFSLFFWQLVGSRLLLNLSFISLRYWSKFSFLRWKLVRWGIGLIVKSICNLVRIVRWYEPRIVFVCQLVEVIREDDANDTSGEGTYGRSLFDGGPCYEH